MNQHAWGSVKCSKWVWQKWMASYDLIFILLYKNILIYIQVYAFKDPNLNPECASEWPWSLTELQISMLAMAA